MESRSIKKAIEYNLPLIATNFYQQEQIWNVARGYQDSTVVVFLISVIIIVRNIFHNFMWHLCTTLQNFTNLTIY